MNCNIIYKVTCIYSRNIVDLIMLSNTWQSIFIHKEQQIQLIIIA